MTDNAEIMPYFTKDLTIAHQNMYTFYAEPFEGITRWVRDAQLEMLDRMTYPWKYPDRPRLPEIELFPRLTRWENRLKRWRKRVTDVVYVARSGLPESGGYDW